MRAGTGSAAGRRRRRANAAPPPQCRHSPSTRAQPV